MKVRNIAFSGFAAAILAGVCGNAFAASVNLASKGYVDGALQSKADLIDLKELETTVGKKATQESLNLVATQVNVNTTDIADLKSGKQNTLTAGTNITIDGNVISAVGGVSAEELLNLQTTLEAAIAEKQDKGEYLVAADLTDLQNAVSALQTGKADAETVSTMQETISKLGETYATKSEMTAADEALQAAIDAIDIPSLADYAKTADVDAALALKADKTELNNLVTSEQLSALNTALQAEIAKKQAAGDYAQAESLQNVANELSTLKKDVYTKAEVDQKIADAASGGSVDLSGYATTSALDALTALVSGNTDEIAALKAAGYQTSSDVQGAITSAVADLATKSEVNAKQDKLTAGTNITIDGNVISAVGGVSAEELSNLQTTLEAAIAEKQAKGDYAAASELEALQSTVETLQSGSADKTVVETLQTTVESIANDYAKKSELTSAEERLQAAIDAIDIPSLAEYVKSSDLAKVAKTGLYSDLEGLPEIPSIAGLATSEELSNLQTTLEAAIAEKQDKGEYLVAADLTDLQNAVSALQTGKADAETVSTMQETISKLGETYATKSEMTAADEALQAAIDAIDIPSLADYAKTADVDAALALKADKTELNNLVTSEQLTALNTALQAEIAKKQAAGDYVQAESLQNVANELSTLKKDVYTKAEVDQKIADAASGGSVDLSGYATTSALDALTALVSGKQDTLKAGAGITITDNTISADVDTSSLITKPAEQPTTFGEYVLILNINEAGESEGYSWLDTLDLMGDSGFDM